jgi:hypothetical protein
MTLQGYRLRFVLANPLCTGCRNHVLHGVYVKDVMQRQIAPELRKVHKLTPQVYKYMREKGVHVVLAIDNTSRQVFAGITTKLEQGCIKLLLPHVKHALQSPSLAIPIFFMEGELLTHAANTRWSIYAEDHLACNGLMFLSFYQGLLTGLCASVRTRAYGRQPLKSVKGNQNGNVHLASIHVEWHSQFVLDLDSQLHL